ncbi:MAG: ribonuclease III [Desulfuromonadales bacterium]|jgi:ribonuclease-3
MISPVSGDGDLWRDLEKALGYSFRDKALLVNAMTHKSFANEYSPAACPDNERLEFLGDAVLDLVVSEHLMEALPTSNEGELSRIRADVVAMSSLAGLASKLGLGPSLLLGKGEFGSGGREKPGLLADALEALFGAVFVDGGYEAAKSVLLPLVVPLLRQASADAGQDYKSRLQEILQANRKELPVYRVTGTRGPDHDPVYLVEVLIGDRVYGSGEGRTKKTAEQNAAQATLQLLDKAS